VKSDFEKLVIARRYIEILEKENELLKLEVEAEHKRVGEAKKALREEIDRKEKLTAAEKFEIKSGLYVKQMKESIHNLKTKLKAATEENKKLVQQVIKLKSGQ
jgi:predicted RNase H-like nuclease (RuvC/YqgF family)